MKAVTASSLLGKRRAGIPGSPAGFEFVAAPGAFKPTTDAQLDLGQRQAVTFVGLLQVLASDPRGPSQGGTMLVCTLNGLNY